ncbi:MAG TPA: tRNA (N(6)-L-threonylcarbamoyladenosine(37)-C(2))-methylthiotransferase MtaB [Vicinamibacterales bacterium]|nr:tRNA (N(6)-L-threonylcarbamoyladenosine(37)-C(2))-methylthiotransferase MtaB [Vicinamibacterales bacterium]
MKYSVVTFGCRVNQADSLEIEGSLRARGAVCASPDQADLVIVNTCSVTATADQGARQTIRRIARNNPDVRIVVTGCYATRRPSELSDLPNVTHVVSNQLKDDLLSTIAFADPEPHSTATRYGDGDGPCGALEPGVAGRTAFTLRVQTGCEERCSYCIIPTTRGHSRSLPLMEITRRLGHVVAAGYKEIIITGVHLGSYGRDLDDGSTLTALVHHLADSDADVLFRISSLEPMDCTEDMIDLVAGSRRLAPHFHLPLQHGADSVLRRMRRPYTVGAYRQLIERIRTVIPHASIGSDVIVGFPGETASEFQQTESLLCDLPLTHLHVFPYSDRPGTDATAMDDKVDGVAIRERGQRVRAIGHDMATRFRQSQLGTVRRALTVDDGLSAVTDNFLKVRLAEMVPRNQWINARID